MKDRKMFMMRRMLGMIVMFSMLAQAPVFADNWYDYYHQAKQAAQRKDWPTAIALLHKAIAEEPEPAKHKQYGLRAFSYYPYLDLGMAYLSIGNMKAAYENCTLADQKRSAPEQAVKSCLSIAASYLPQAPAATPVPVAKEALAATDFSEHPTARLTTPLPATTTADAIVLQGAGLDKDGVVMIEFSVTNRGLGVTTTLTTPNQRPEEPFNIKIPIDFGLTEINIVVTDTQGEKGTQTLAIERLGSPPPKKATPMPDIVIQPTATPVPLGSPTATPMPTPKTPSAQPGLRLLSDIPPETSQAILTVAGVAEDADGIAEITFDVKQPDTRGLILELDEDLSRGPQPHVQFSKDVPLEIGANTVTIIARNTAGLEQTTQFHVTRIVADTPVVAGPAGDVYAVIIGIAEYEDPRLNLNYTVNDAQGLRDVLIDPAYGGVPPDNIRLLLNENATYKNIKREIGTWLAQKADTDDTVIVYYSGHGAPEGNETYWVTYDADIDDLYSTALSNNEIADMFSRIQSQRMVTFLDACYSEATVYRRDKTKSVGTEIPWEDFTGTGRVVISASDGTQFSLELDEFKHGVFTYYLLEGLRGQADANQDYVVEVEEAWDYVRRRVSETAKKRSINQTPVFQGRLTAGISLTVNLFKINLERKLAKLKSLFDEDRLSVEHLNCTFQMLKEGKTDRYLDNLLDDKISPEIFSRFFACP